MVRDPYRALGLSHDASKVQIKQAYRRLAMLYHPDRLQRTNASKEEITRATTNFAACAEAFSLLSDEKRKREYDYIYKFGGYDDLPQKCYNSRDYNGRKSPEDQENVNPNKRPVPQKGIGYTLVDPFIYIMSQGKIKSKAVASVTVPSRFNMAHTPGGGFRLCFSSGQLQECPSGTIEYTSKTTQFADGKKFSKTETTKIHNDGRKEVVIEGDDYVERRFIKASKRKRRSSKDKDDLTHTGDELPWYMSAWNGLRANLTMCTNPSN
jgi:curved DNA-binding protein CbpA